MLRREAQQQRAQDDHRVVMRAEGQRAGAGASGAEFIRDKRCPPLTGPSGARGDLRDGEAADRAGAFLVEDDAVGEDAGAFHLACTDATALDGTVG